MRRWLVLVAMSGLPAALQAQGVPRLDPTASRGDTTPVVMTAADSAVRIGRETASRVLFHQCTGYAFQTCGAGETAARLSLDGTAYGVLLNVQDPKGGGHSIFLWRITGHVSLNGAETDEEGGGGPGGKVRKPHRSKRGGG